MIGHLTLTRGVYYCISPNVGRYYGLVTGPPPAMEATMEAAAATERFRRLLLAKKKIFRSYVGLSVCPNVCFGGVGNHLKHVEMQKKKKISLTISYFGAGGWGGDQVQNLMA